MRTADEIEADRIERLEQLDREHTDEPDWRKRFAPGSLGCHEALHTASILQAVLDDHLLHHPAVVLDPESFALTSRASDALAELYQVIGQRHGSG